MDLFVKLHLPWPSLKDGIEVDAEKSWVAGKTVNASSVPGVGSFVDVYGLLPPRVWPAGRFAVAKMELDFAGEGSDTDSASVELYGVLTIDKAGSVSVEMTEEIRDLLVAGGWMTGVLADDQTARWDERLAELRETEWAEGYESVGDLPCPIDWVDTKRPNPSEPINFRSNSPKRAAK